MSSTDATLSTRRLEERTNGIVQEASYCFIKRASRTVSRTLTVKYQFRGVKQGHGGLQNNATQQSKMKIDSSEGNVDFGAQYLEISTKFW